MNVENSVEYGLRSSYRLKGSSEVVTQDFYGVDKGQASEDFLKPILGREDYNSTSVVFPE